MMVAVWLTLGLACGLLPRDPCADMAGDPPLYAACITEEASHAATATEALSACEALGPPMHDHCLARWVEDHPHAGSFEELMPLCTGSADCVMLLLDQRPVGAIDEEIRLCRAYAGAFVGDCVGHAAQRWLATRPTDEALKAFASGPNGSTVIRLVPAYLQCLGRTRCPDLGRATGLCEAGMLHREEDPCRLFASTRMSPPSE